MDALELGYVGIYGGYSKSCMTLSTIYLGNYRIIVDKGHAGFLV